MTTRRVGWAWLVLALSGCTSDEPRDGNATSLTDDADDDGEVADGPDDGPGGTGSGSNDTVIDEGDDSAGQLDDGADDDAPTRPPRPNPGRDIPFEPEPGVEPSAPEPAVDREPEPVSAEPEGPGPRPSGDDAPSEPEMASSEPEAGGTNEPDDVNPGGGCAVPGEVALEDTSNPDVVIGDGTAESCTGDAVVDAVARGGVITFDCGPDPVTITLDRPAKVFNDTGPKIVLDGGGLVTLSGGGSTRILYMNTCDEAQHWTTAHCDNQDHPELTVQNLTFVDGNSTDETEYDGGGAIWVRGGRFKVLNSRFFNNTCASVGPDVGGGAIRVFSQYEGRPVYVIDSVFGGAEGMGNVGSNGGALSSIGVSWTIVDSVLSYNRAVGDGGNPAQDGTQGGGSGGAIYNDGNTMTLSICSSRIEYNEVNAYGSAIFFVSNDHSGDIEIVDSVITNNIGGSWYPTYPQISNHDDTPIRVTNSTIE